MALIPRRERNLGLGVAAGAAALNVARNYGYAWDQVKRLINDNKAAHEELTKAVQKDQMKRGRSKSTYKNQKKDYGVKKPRSMNLRVGGFMGQGLKYYDTESAVQFHTYSYLRNITPDGIACPGQGSTASERLGRSFQLKAIDFRCVIYPGSNTGAAEQMRDCTVTLFFVHDMQTNGATDVNPDLVFKNNHMSPLRNMENTDRFRIICKKKVVLKSTAIEAATTISPTSTYGGSLGTLECYKKMDVKVTMKDTAPGNGNVQDNSVFVVAHYNVNAPSAPSYNPPSVSWAARARFIG